jgi:hypothetical protein
MRMSAGTPKRARSRRTIAMLNSFLPASTSLTRLGMPRIGTMSARVSVLIHQVSNRFGSARRSARPLAPFVGSDQTRLRREPGDVGWIIRIPQPIDEGASASELGIAIDHDQDCIHQTVSASMSLCCALLANKRIARATALYWTAATKRSAAEIAISDVASCWH